MAIVLSAIVVLLPLILMPRLVVYHDITPKVVVLLVGTSVALILAVRGERLQSAVVRIFGLLLAFQAGSLALSTLFSIDPALSLGGGAWRRFGLVTQTAMLVFGWLVVQFAAGGQDRLRLLLRAIAAAGIPISIYALLQYSGWDPWIDPRAYHIGPAPLTIVRPPGTLGHASYLATYLLSVIFSGVALTIVEESRSMKILGAAAAVAGTAALILTGTRAALLGLAAGLLFLLIAVRPRLRARALMLAAAALALMVGFYFSPAGHLLRNRTLWNSGDPWGGGRLLLWRDSLRMAAARPLVGFGPDTFSLVFPRFQSAELARAYPDFYQESPHSIFIDALVSQGAAGAAILIGVAALGFYCVWISPDRKVAAALGAALVAALVSQQFTSFTLPTGVFFYLTVALLVAHACPAVPGFASRTGRYVCSALALPFVLFAAALFTADASLARVYRQIRGAKPIEAMAGYQRLLALEPPGMRTDLDYSRALAAAASSAGNRTEALALWQQGLTAAVRASRNAEDRQNAWHNLAMFYGKQNDYRHTEQSLRSAIAAAPNWFKSHWLLAQVLRSGGRLQEARLEAELALSLNGGRYPEVARTAEEIRALTGRTNK